MGVRKSGPLGLHLHLDGAFEPHLSFTYPARLVLPGPLGTASWHDAISDSLGKIGGGQTQLDYDKVYQHIKRWEGVIRHMYLDTHDPPLVTVGAGNMLPNSAAAQALPFINTRSNKPATPDEISAAFHSVAAMTGGLPARKYKLNPSLEISEETAKALAVSRLKREFLPGLRKWSRGFDRFPLPAREALIDMAYNGGVGRPEKVVKGTLKGPTGLYKFRRLMAAAAAGNWLAASMACHSSSSRPERSQFRKDLFREAARIVARSKAAHSW